MVSPDEIAFIRTHPNHVLQEMLVSIEEYVAFATEKRWLAEIPDKETRISVIKSELAQRGVFDDE
jgi:hypothetical protein